MKLLQAINETKTEKEIESEFNKEFGKVKSFLLNYPYGQENYNDVDKYKDANKIVADLQLSYSRNVGDYQKVVNAAKKYLNKMAHDFGDFYKGKTNVKWHDAMQSLDRLKEIGGKL